MTQSYWMNEFSKYIYLLPANEQREVLEYYKETFAEAKSGGLSENDVCNQLGDPKEAAKELINSFIDEKEEDERSLSEPKAQINEDKADKYRKQGENFGNKVKDTCKNAWVATSNFVSGMFSKKKAKKLNDQEKADFEKEIQESRNEMTQGVDAEILREKDEEIQHLREANARLVEEQREKAKAEETKTAEKATYKEIKENGYTIASKKSPFDNIMHTFFLSLLLILGIGLVVGGIWRLAIEIASCISNLGGVTTVNADYFSLLGFYIVMMFTWLLTFTAGVMCIGGFATGIHKRYIKKHYKIKEEKK